MTRADEPASPAEEEIEERRQMAIDAGRLVVLALNVGGVRDLLNACELLRDVMSALEAIEELPPPPWRADTPAPVPAPPAPAARASPASRRHQARARGQKGEARGPNDPSTSAPIGALPASHPLAELDAAILADRRDALAAARCRSRRLEAEPPPARAA